MPQLRAQCIRHPDYRGWGVPNIQCKTCCLLFLWVVQTTEREKAEANSNVAK